MFASVLAISVHSSYAVEMVNLCKGCQASILTIAIVAGFGDCADQRRL